MAGLLHGPNQQLVRLAPRRVGHRVVGGVVVEWIHFLALHEIENLHALGGRWRQLLDLLIVDQDVGVLGVLVALDDLAALDGAVTGRAIELLLDARVALFVELVEADLLAPCRREQADRDRDQAESEISLPNG
jgi:hypothetical protein